MCAFTKNLDNHSNLSTMLKYSLLYFFAYFCFAFSSGDLSYGPFKMMITEFGVCHGPKRKDCSIINTTIIEHGAISIDVLVTENCAPSKGKIVASSSGKELVRLHMNKPCEHLFLRPMLTGFFNITKNCRILKGRYKSRVDIEQIAANYFGGNFFYGNITFKANLFSNDCNFSCTNLNVTMTPKNKS